MTKNTDFSIGQVITVTPQGMGYFEVVEIDETSSDMIQVDPVFSDLAPFWVSTTYARPTEAMSRPDLTEWFRRHGVDDETFMDELMEQYFGKTLDEMEQVHEAMHGSMA